MGLVINTNISSLNAQRTLSKNSSQLSKTLQRLSSGMRINSAADDAAGLAISNGLTSQIKGLNQAIRNAGDGLSLLGTAEGAITEQTNILQRLRELAVQASSDTNSSSNRSALNSEATQLKNEFDRISKTVQFNGINLLDGSFTSKQIQVGANSGANERISIDISGTRAIDLGSAYKLTGSAATTSDALSDGGVTITSNGTTVNVGASTDDGLSTADETGSALAKANAINAVFAQTNVSASASTTRAATADVTAGTLDGTNSITINGESVTGAITADEAGALALATTINTLTAKTGVTASVTNTTQIILTADDGRNITVVAAGTGAALSGLADGTTQGSLELSSASEFTVAGSQIAALGTGVSGTAAVDTSENVSTLDIASKSGANQAIGVIDVAIENLNTARGLIGAQNNRLNITISSLASTSENLSSSNSRIIDADFASETASLSRTQILQQAAVAILSQANQSPQLALSLLR